jgi:ABC-type nitrate/sulfonate/bicarbonate transport system permease component
VKRAARLARTPLTSVVVVLVLVVVWVVAQRLSGLDRALFPTPGDVVDAAVEHPGELWSAARTTLVGAMGGFVVGNLAGVLLALLVARSVLASRLVLPLAIGIRVIPVIALAPLLTLVLGRGLATVVTVAALLVFFPTLINGVLGLRSVTADQVDMLRMVNASSWQIFRRLRLPAAMPSLFAAFQVAAASSVLGAMLAEWVASGNGLGYLILRSSFSFEVGLMWAAVILATLITVGAATLTAFVGRRVVGWQAPD